MREIRFFENFNALFVERLDDNDARRVTMRVGGCEGAEFDSAVHNGECFGGFGRSGICWADSMTGAGLSMDGI